MSGYDLAENVVACVKPSSLWEAIPVFTVDVAVQTFAWVLLISLFFQMSICFSKKTHTPWRNFLTRRTFLARGLLICGPFRASYA